MIRVSKKSILPLGFLANGTASGIKRSAKPDLALLYSQTPAKAVCKFTTNSLPAAPIILNRKNLENNKQFRAVIINSGNANCFNGAQGLTDARITIASLAKVLRINKNSILVASTGIIGKKLPVLKIRKSIPDLVKGLSPAGIDKAKIAIMTTDTYPKAITVKFNIGRQILTICGIAKGAGMIAPDLATMLAFILTDANITQTALNKALTVCLDNSFNCITVDGCMSTNDTVMLLANGASRNNLIDKQRNFEIFVHCLNIVCTELATMIVNDAEGAKKFITIRVLQAKNYPEAKKLGLAVANSNLFKTAMHGENPNFGRIVAALGATKIKLGANDLKIKLSSLKKKMINVEIKLGRGKAGCTIYTSDLSYEYVKINAAYS